MKSKLVGRLSVGADLRAARGEWGVQAVNRPARRSLPKPSIISDYERSRITPISKFGDDSRADQAKQIQDFNLGGSLSHRATRPERGKSGLVAGVRFDRNNVMLLPITNLPPFQGGSVLLGVFPGLKPWAESCCPFGTGLPVQTPNLELQTPNLEPQTPNTRPARL